MTAASAPTAAVAATALAHVHPHHARPKSAVVPNVWFAPSAAAVASRQSVHRSQIRCKPRWATSVQTAMPRSVNAKKMAKKPSRPAWSVVHVRQAVLRHDAAVLQAVASAVAAQVAVMVAVMVAVVQVAIAAKAAVAAAFETGVGSLRTSKRWTSRFYGPAVAALSMVVAGGLLRAALDALSAAGLGGAAAALGAAAAVAAAGSSA